MSAQITELLDEVTSAVGGWFVDIFDATDQTAFYLSMIFLILTFRYLLAPFLGSVFSSGSDKASKEK